MAARKKLALSEVLTWRFFLNCIFSLLATIWFPLAKISAVDGEGNVLSSSYLPMYRLYWSVIKSPTTWTAWWYIFVHATIIFSVSFFVWYLFLKTRKQLDAEHGEEKVAES